MITLVPITDPQKLEEYFRFRYRVYRESVQQALLNTADGVDRDVYDEGAVHLGWYRGERLIGCVRFVHPIPAELSLYCFTHMPQQPTAVVHQLMHGYLDRGLPFVEVSRICIEPARRDLGTIRDFVLATMAISHTMRLDQAVFTCIKPHVPFWRRMGFTLLPGAEEWLDTKVNEPYACMVYRHAQLPHHILNALPPYLKAHGHTEAA